MDPLQPTTSTLEPAIAHIAEVSTTLISTLSERRRSSAISKVPADPKHHKYTTKEKIEIITWIRKSPLTIKTLVEQNKLDEAVQNWKLIEALLEKWIAVKGVAEIRDDCMKYISSALQNSETIDNTDGI